MHNFKSITQKLRQLNIPFEEITFKDSVISARTSDTSTEHNFDPNTSIKTLLVKSHAGYHAVLINGHKKINSLSLNKLIGRWKIIDTGTLQNRFGFLPGTVCPLVLNIPLIIDTSLQYQKVWCTGAGDNQKGLNFNGQDVLDNLENVIIDSVSQKQDRHLSIVSKNQNMNQINQALTRRASTIMPSKEGLMKLMQSRRIRLYQGFDPSSPNLHIGHLVGLLQLKSFQDLGHEVIFLIGDFTGMVGDPSDKSAVRPKLTHEQVLKNAKTYQEQAGKILNFEGDNAAKILFNADWLMKLNFADVLEISSNVTVQQLIERDMFQKRLSNGKPIYLHEFMYPLLQGYDSVHMEVDLEVGGHDQLFNLMIGRQLLKAIKNKEKYCLTTKLLSDSTGIKVGKTTGNAVNLFGSINDLFGGIMALPDDIIVSAFELITEVPLEEINQVKKQLSPDPMTQKKRLAFEVAKLCYGLQPAQKAQAHFETTVQQGHTPDNIPILTLKPGAYTSLATIQQAGTGLSSSEIKRLHQQGGVEWNGQKVTDFNKQFTIKKGDTIKIGKRTYRRIILDS